MKGVGGKEDRALQENNSQTSDRDFKSSDGRIRDSDIKSDDLGLSEPVVKAIGEFEEISDEWQKSYVREVKRFQE